MSKVHNLYEIRFAQKVCKDIPNIQQKLDEIIKICQPYLEYREIGEVHSKVNDAKTMLKLQHNHYKEILDNIGVNND